ncbi:hypothetical protein [Arthrobacter sp. 92]|uniref:hypothetical protein n=1 Tax=Arthrobacter sp. 92 TaxID=3418175 RepID=UPI003D052B79
MVLLPSAPSRAPRGVRAAARGPAVRRRVSTLAIGASVVLAATACSSAVSVENADVPAWKATALPSASAIALEDAGKILNRDPRTKDAANLAPGRYTLTMTCDGGGKAFFAVSTGGKKLAEAGAACNGSRETARITLATAGTVQISASSVDAPILYAYQLVAAS